MNSVTIFDDTRVLSKCFFSAGAQGVQHSEVPEGSKAIEFVFHQDVVLGSAAVYQMNKCVVILIVHDTSGQLKQWGNACTTSQHAYPGERVRSVGEITQWSPPFSCNTDLPLLFKALS